jgi:hypothetical protein
MTFSNIHGELMVNELDTETKLGFVDNITNLIVFINFSKKNLLVAHCLQPDVLEFYQFLSPYNKHAKHFPCFHHCIYQ